MHETNYYYIFKGGVNHQSQTESQLVNIFSAKDGSNSNTSYLSNAGKFHEPKQPSDSYANTSPDYHHSNNPEPHSQLPEPKPISTPNNYLTTLTTDLHEKEPSRQPELPQFPLDLNNTLSLRPPTNINQEEEQGTQVEEAPTPQENLRARNNMITPGQYEFIIQPFHVVPHVFINPPQNPRVIINISQERSRLQGKGRERFNTIF
ncbi:UNVERIFIED_CONTAM: hypothetical protein Slati_0938600 [Sesamum latifolium]|uniref:Uncharacterized protein n=1 Tax=Sesamum latifolium TaxID=2727402 RepID=A0AAW2XQ16_9LAMI